MKLTKLRQQCLNDLASGAKLIVTLPTREGYDVNYEIVGGE